jgi:hypothetical protein
MTRQKSLDEHALRESNGADVSTTVFLAWVG